MNFLIKIYKLRIWLAFASTVMFFVLQTYDWNEFKLVLKYSYRARTTTSQTRDRPGWVDLILYYHLEKEN